EAVEVVTTAKLITEVVAAVSETVSAAAVIQADVPAALDNAAAVVTTAATVKVVVPSTRQKRGVVIKDPEVKSSTKTPTKTKLKDKGKGIMVEEPKPIKKKQQVELDEAYARKLQEELNQDIDWEVAMDHVKQKAKENPYIEEEESRAIALINETPAQKAVKRRRLNKEAEDVEELKQHLEIMPDEDDDVYTEATPLARKVPVVDYQIIHVNNKPRYKIIRADDTQQLYRSFITMLKNFDREDLQTLWNIVKERFSTSKPNNFSDEYLLSTLKMMFGRPDEQDNVWKDQRSVYGQALVKRWKLLTSCGVYIISFTTTQIILLVERRYPLSKFTLEQMLNVVRLQVEEQSEMSLHALVDKKRIMISEEVVCEILQLNDAEGVVCLPNEEIFAGLARMGYEKPSTKLTFYNSAMASALICLSSGQRFNFSKYIFESLVSNVDSTSKFYMYPRVGKGFSGVKTPLFENMLAVRVVDAEEVQVHAQDDVVQEHVTEEIATEVVPPTPTSPSPSSSVIPSSPPHQSPYPPQPQAAEGSSQLIQQVLDTCSALVLRVEGLENANAVQQLEIIKLKARVKKLERLNKVKSSKLRRLKKVGTSQCIESSDDVENVFNQGRISVDMEIDEGIELQVDQEKDAEIKGRHADTQAEICNIDLDHSSKVLSMQEDTEVQEAVEVVTTARLITQVVTVEIERIVVSSDGLDLYLG
nr:hypothetical protein [Tanacetum cinerariifolium]